MNTEQTNTKPRTPEDGPQDNELTTKIRELVAEELANYFTSDRSTHSPARYRISDLALCLSDVLANVLAAVSEGNVAHSTEGALHLTKAILSMLPDACKKARLSVLLGDTARSMAEKASQQPPVSEPTAAQQPAA